MMTFEEFQATRTFVPDARKSGLPNFQDFIAQYQHPVPVLVYRGFMCIEIHTREWIDCEEQYLLVIENQQWSGDDLEALEKELYEWDKVANENGG